MNYLDKDELLSKLGLERRPSATSSLLSALGPFALGILVGAGVVFFLAPRLGQGSREPAAPDRDGFASWPGGKPAGVAAEADAKPA